MGIRGQFAEALGRIVGPSSHDDPKQCLRSKWKKSRNPSVHMPGEFLKQTAYREALMRSQTKGGSMKVLERQRSCRAVLQRAPSRLNSVAEVISRSPSTEEVHRRPSSRSLEPSLMRSRTVADWAARSEPKAEVQTLEDLLAVNHKLEKRIRGAADTDIRKPRFARALNVGAVTRSRSLNQDLLAVNHKLEKRIRGAADADVRKPRFARALNVGALTRSRSLNQDRSAPAARDCCDRLRCVGSQEFGAAVKALGEAERNEQTVVCVDCTQLLHRTTPKLTGRLGLVVKTDSANTARTPFDSPRSKESVFDDIPEAEENDIADHRLQSNEDANVCHYQCRRARRLTNVRSGHGWSWWPLPLWPAVCQCTGCREK